MNSTPYIFKKKLIEKKLAHFTKDSIPDYDTKFAEIRRWCNATEEKYLDRTKETNVQGAFLTRLFSQVFGYLQVVDEGDCYNQESEFNVVLDTSEADGALGFFYKGEGRKDVRVVIELKDARTNLDKKQNRKSHLTPVEQAFIYANKSGSKCGWVIVSNFIETRLYKSTSSLEYETFDMRKMTDPNEFLRFYYFMSKEHLIAEDGKSIIDQLYIQNEEEGVAISKKFYGQYKALRNNLFKCLKDKNPSIDEILLFTKTQKLMDRFIFICFCEDCDLLPQKTFENLIASAKSSYTFSENKIWDELKGLFASIDKGNPPMKINQFNGGLFKYDDELDSLLIPNQIFESFSDLSRYDFTSDLNVNILGQIFEQSISDVEQIKQEIRGKKDGSHKQKDDGIFYTPYYVTRYIVEETVGAYLSEKREQIKKDLFSKGTISIKAFKLKYTRRGQKEHYKTIKFDEWEENVPDHITDKQEVFLHQQALDKLHLMYYEEYEKVLKNLKICDPSCGSGAFLTQCFDFLHEEMDFVLNTKALLTRGQFNFLDINKEILQNNLYGVDINPESVEITKLALWLKTAKNNQTLATLDNNIKCGNSLVSNKNIVDNAFDWKEAFPEIFKNGGFDIIIGNPPYGAKLEKSTKKYIVQNYSICEGEIDTYHVFFELGLKLLKKNGYLGYITPNTYFDIRSGKKLRNLLFSYSLRKVVEVYNVFPNAVVEPVISIYKKEYVSEDEQFEVIRIPRNVALTSTFLTEGIIRVRKQKDLKKNENLIFNYMISEEDEIIVDTISERSKKLKENYYVYNGAKPYEKGKGNPPQTKEIIDNKIYNGYEKKDDTWIPYMRGKKISRYTTLWDGEYIKYGENLAAPRDPEIFFREKIFIRQTSDSIIAQIDNGNVANNTLHIIFPKNDNLSNKYLLGILNSTFMTWYFRVNHPLEVGKPLAEVKKIFIEELPVIFGTKSQEEALINLVNAMLSLCEKRRLQKSQFLNYVKKAYKPKEISEKMENFDKISFKDFCNELKHQKVKLTAILQKDLLELYEKEVSALVIITSQIRNQQAAIDDKVFEIYDISPDDANRIKMSIEMEL